MRITRRVARVAWIGFTLILISGLPACSTASTRAKPPVTRSAEISDPASPVDPLDQPHPDWRVLDKVFGVKGALNGSVYTIDLPRADLEMSIEGMPVPAEAACSTFRFYRCDCGKMSVAGEFCLVDYEANDVIDALRAGGFRIAAMGDMFVGVKPPLVILRFQGEARGSDIYRPILQSLQWIGPACLRQMPLRTKPSSDPLK